MSKPEIPQGYLGAQPKWSEYGLSTVTHNSPEIKVNDTKLEIKIKTSKPTKVTTNLIEGGTDKEYKELVFTQTQGDTITLIVLPPAAGFFKLQIYALPAADDSKTLLNVYNYLIQATKAPRSPPAPFPKQFAQWKEGCYLHEPLSLTNLSNLDSVNFKVVVPGAKAVAVTVDSEWFHLTEGSDGIWQGQVKGLSKLKGKATKASLNANYGTDETKYTSLLEYTL
ncbi:uncharacterized protein [Littorina saxatilis]|uniref:KY-like immunoglobulin-like domain-containing protein n=1 Tax=Littorina saxatilis TaxID=31220 RepID=A0AAN9BTM9_9CAEN